MTYHPPHRSNCDPRVAEMLRGLYRWPDFLPEDGEGSAIDWIFMGTPGQGTAVHVSLRPLVACGKVGDLWWRVVKSETSGGVW